MTKLNYLISHNQDLSFLVDNSIQIIFNSKTVIKKANDAHMIEDTAEQFLQKNEKLHGASAQGLTDAKDINDTDKENSKVPINALPHKKSIYTKRTIYKHNVRRTVLMHHQSTITEPNKSTGTMTYCGIVAERPFEEHCRDANINTTSAADRPYWCRQRSAPNLAEPVKLISSDVQYIGNISLLPEKEPRGEVSLLFPN